jgi:hypothetical protein
VAGQALGLRETWYQQLASQCLVSLRLLLGIATLPAPRSFSPPFVARIYLVALGAIVLITCVVLEGLTRTVIFTGTHANAPTFWQRYRVEIMIALAISAVFYLLGLFTPH